MPALPIEDAETLVANALIGSGCAPGNAMSVARALVGAEIDGQAGHGLNRVGSYCAQVKAGKVVGDAKPGVTRALPGWIAVDAGHGFAFPAFDLAVDAVSSAAAETGIAAAAVFRSHHCGQAGRHVERLADRGCVGLLFANTPEAMAPWGGSKPLFGTNPIAFAAPRRGAESLVIDLSLSTVARGKVMAASKKGELIPEGWALDAEGNPTTDAAAGLAGSMVPMGDAKGAALALMVEVMAAALTGGRFGFEATSFLNAEGGPPDVGQLLIAIDMRATAGEGFLDRMEALTGAMLAQDGVRLPGSSRIAKREAAARDGITISDAVMAELNELAG
jgi:(2R)-3-sulfolactate dehydrogenase (NADP+)